MDERTDKKTDVILIALSGMEIGVRTLSAVLKEKGFSVLLGLFDAWHADDRAGLEHIRAWVHEHAPKVVGVSVSEISRAKTIALITALKKDGVTVIAGGPDVSLNPDFFLKYADYIICGEGEYAMAEFVKAMVGGQDVRHIQNLWYTDGKGGVVRNAQRPIIDPLDAIPYEDLFDIHDHFELYNGRIQQRQSFAMGRKYALLDKKTLFVVTSRGCGTPWCSYCSNHKIGTGGKPFRARSAMSVVERIEKISLADPTIGLIAFCDDDFLMRSEEDIHCFAREWKARVNLGFFILCSPQSVTKSKVEALIDAGLVLVHMGIQSGSERINYEIFKRPIPASSVINAVALFNTYVGRGRFGFLPPGCEIIINNPYETEQDIMGTLSLIRQLPEPRIMIVFGLVFFQGGDLYHRAIQEGILRTEQDEGTAFEFTDSMLDQKRRTHYYLNSLLCWMAGLQVKGQYGIVPVKALDFLCRASTIRFFNAHPRIVSMLNRIAFIMNRLSGVYDYQTIRKKCWHK